VRELAPGHLALVWRTPAQRPVGVDLEPVLPAGCEVTGAPAVASDGVAVTLRSAAVCSGGGLPGRRFRVDGLDQSPTEVLLRVELADGRSAQAVLRAGAAEFVVPERARRWDVVRGYIGLGVSHILGGPDHLLFVLGLVLLVRGRRRLLGTVTAFTVGHSVTLSLAALGFVDFPTRPVELAIAASILVLAVDLERDERVPPSLLRRAPWLVAGLFGLLHGLGFAGALAQVGLPAEEIPLALASFNLGIELGQLAFVAVVLVARGALRPLARTAPPWLAHAPAYAIGSLAAYWCFERAAARL
jgi:hydrogenase/urease accessory protein HupE